MKLDGLQPLSPKPCWGSDPSEGGLKMIPWALKFLCMHQARPLKSKQYHSDHIVLPHSELLFPKLSWHVLWNYQPPDYVSRCHLLLRQEYTSKILLEKLFRFSTRNFFFFDEVICFFLTIRIFVEGEAWRIPGMGEPGGLLSMGSHRVGHDWSDLAVAAAEWGWVSLGEAKMTFYWNSHWVVSAPGLIRLSEANSLCSNF